MHKVEEKGGGRVRDGSYPLAVEDNTGVTNTQLMFIFYTKICKNWQSVLVKKTYLI
jgi:hypothetical protein